MYSDTHAHLYAEQFDNDRDEMIQRALKQGVTYLFLPNIDIASIEPMLALEARYPQNCFAMMGLHPCSVEADYEAHLAVMEQWLQRRKFIAIGEIGLDYYWSRTFVEQQKQAFRRQAQWAKQLEIPIILHARDSLDDLIQLVREEKTPQLRGIFHCFSGNVAQAQAVIEMGFMIGIGGVATYKKSGLEEVLSQIDLQHIVLETDAPYLSPVPHRGKRNESSYIPIVAQKIAEIKALPTKEVAQITTNNALSMFGLKN